MYSNSLIRYIDIAFQRFISIIFQTAYVILPHRVGEKLMQFEKNGAANNILGLIFFNALGGLLLLITQIQIANFLGASSYGLYAYCIAIGEIGAGLVRYGRHKTMLRDLTANPDKKNSIIKGTFIVGLLNYAVFLLLVIIFHEFLKIDSSITCILLIATPSIVSLDFQPVYENLRLMSWHSIYNLIQKFLFLLPIWVAIILFKELTLSFVAIVFFLSWTIVVISEYCEIKGKLGVRFFEKLKEINFADLYKNNAIVTICCMSGVAFGPLIRFILKQESGSAELGIFSAGYQILVLSQFVINQIGRFSNPQLTELCARSNNYQQRVKFLKNYSACMFLAVLPFSICLTFFPGFIAESFFSAEYKDITLILPILGVYLLFCSQGIVYNQYMIAIKNDKTYFTIYTGCAVLSLTIALILIPHLGIVGATLALCLSDGLASILYFFNSVKNLRKLHAVQ